MTQTKFTTLPKENWDSEATIEEKNQCPAADWNQVANEIIDVVEKSGEDADTNLQMAQAIVRNALCGDFFTDASTAADTIILDVNGSFSKPTEYIDGMKVSFIPLYSNTGPATVNVNGLGATSIYLDANSTALSGSEIAVDKLTELRYNATIDGFILYNLVLSDVSKINLSGDNATFSALAATAISNIQKLITPNYSAPVSKTTTSTGWTADANGKVYAFYSGTSDTEFYVNGAKVGKVNGYDITGGSSFFEVFIGDVITYNHNISECIFYPYRTL